MIEVKVVAVKMEDIKEVQDIIVEEQEIFVSIVENKVIMNINVQ